MFNNTSGFMGADSGWLWLVVILVLLGGGFNRGGVFGGSGGATDGYILTSDFANIERKLDGVNNGICSLGYDQLAQMNGINQNISTTGYAIQNGMMQNTNAIGAQITALGNQLQNCCCENKQQIADLKYTIATEDCATRQAIADGTRAILDRMTADKVECLTAENNALRLSASQQAQNNYLVSQLRPSPVPAYTVANPYCGCGGFNYGYNFGTTIA